MRDFVQRQASEFASSPSPVLRTSSPVPGEEKQSRLGYVNTYATLPNDPARFDADIAALSE